MNELPLYTLKGGLQLCYLVGQEDDFVYLLTDKVVMVCVEVIERREFNQFYQRVNPKSSMDYRALCLLRTATKYGITAWAWQHLRPLVDAAELKYTDAEILAARQMADFKISEWKRLGKRDEDKEMADGKAPRKLAGAALAAKLRKEERERQAAGDEAVTAGYGGEAPPADPPVEKPKGKGGRKPKPVKAEHFKDKAEADTARELADEVTEVLNTAEEAGAADVRLDKVAKKAPAKKAEAAALVQKKVKAARSGIEVFDVAKLKNSDGDYKSASAMFKGLLLENAGAKKPKTDEQIFEVVRAKFPMGDDKLGYVQWNRRWLERAGQLQEKK